MTRIAVVYYSSTGHVHKLAQEIVNGAEEGGADVRLRRAPELAPEEIIRQQDAWHEHFVATRETVEEATLDDLEWADGFAFGTPTRYGTPAAQLKQFIDTTGPLWSEGKLADKTATAFTSAQNAHGGLESTLLTLNNIFIHWGSIIVAPGYTDPLLFEAGGNPYGTSLATGSDGHDALPEAIASAARYQGRRLAEVTARLNGDRAGDRDRFAREGATA